MHLNHYSSDILALLIFEFQIAYYYFKLEFNNRYFGSCLECNHFLSRFHLHHILLQISPKLSLYLFSFWLAFQYPIAEFFYIMLTIVLQFHPDCHCLRFFFLLFQRSSELCLPCVSHSNHHSCKFFSELSLSFFLSFSFQKFLHGIL